MTQDDGAAEHAASHHRFLEATLPHLEAVSRVARHLSQNRQGAEDLVQETYLRAYAAFGSHSGASTRAWLLTICTNLARSSWRRQARRVAEEPRAELDDPGRSSEGVEAAVERRLDGEIVGAALGELPAEQRIAIVLMDLGGQSAAEVARQLGCPRGTVLARVHRGRRRLGELLRERGYDRGLL
ncbi:MAG: sigma-70 family RNA polymerase sigma factor [Actinomycetota bacterium]|nr:sigma-70 family RNA polymerase sigma factor [Actinomycetota bacterium]